jgi:hypothetical protein
MSDDGWDVLLDMDGDWFPCLSRGDWWWAGPAFYHPLAARDFVRRLRLAHEYREGGAARE